jgi:hypothetical protein
MWPINNIFESPTILISLFVFLSHTWTHTHTHTHTHKTIESKKNSIVTKDTFYSGISRFVIPSIINMGLTSGLYKLYRDRVTESKKNIIPY